MSKWDWPVAIVVMVIFVLALSAYITKPPATVCPTSELKGPTL